MSSNIPWIVGLVFATTLVHTLFTIGVFVWLGSVSAPHWTLRNVLSRATVLAGTVFTMLFAAYVEANIWALFYWMEGAIATFEDAIYFSLVTFTTLGYGDITLAPNWRVAGAVEAANGIILFGWTTAIIVAVGQRVFADIDGSTEKSKDSAERP
jgi:hypothetical protein